MSSSHSAIVHTLRASMFMLKRFTADLRPQEFLHRPTAQANCAAWLIGHLTLTDREMLGRLGVKDLPTLPDGFEKRFSRDDGCPQSSEFGDASTLIPTFEKHREALIAAVERAPAEQLDKPLDKPHPLFTTTGEMCNFMGLHTCMHAGQITIIRRSLGRPPLV